MVVRRYEISLRVLKNELTCEIYFKHKKRNFVSPSGHVMFYYFINTNEYEIPKHFTFN